VTITGALSPNILTSLTQVDGVATAITADDHDLTFGWPDGNGSTVNVTGAVDSEYNGDVVLLAVPNRNTFKYQVDSGAPASTTAGVLNEVKNYGYNGGAQITVTGPSEFTYPISATVGTPASGTINLQIKPRISGAVNINKAFLSYTKQFVDNYWAFVVLEDSIASKSRHTQNDADMARGPGTDPRQKVIQNFSIYVFAPSKQEIASRKVRDSMEDVMIALFKSLLGYKPPSVLCETPLDGVTFIQQGFFDYQDSFYIHRFQFQNLVDITFGDTLKEDQDVAFRDIHIDYVDPIVEDGDDVIMTSDINLDTETE
jgi:hypothetical protein